MAVVGNHTNFPVRQPDGIVHAVVGGHYVVNVHRRKAAADRQCTACGNGGILPAGRIGYGIFRALMQQDDAHGGQCLNQRKRVLRGVFIRDKKASFL